MKNYQDSHTEIHVHYSLVFDDGHNNGYAFDCDKDGNVQIPESAQENYAYCLAHKGEFVRAGEVVKYEHRYREPASGECRCGERIYFTGHGYYGAWECPNCGQWWNAFGQELNPPNMWEENLEPDW